jgi:predicted nucleic acid-binding Zn ribbon protein
MPTYHYACTKECTLEDVEAAKEFAFEGTIVGVKSGTLIWEVRHGMTEQPKIKCPLCGKKAKRTIEGIRAPIWYIRGNCYLDKAGCKRDMDLYKLNKGEDPYASMRQPGEVDHIKDKLKRGNKPKPKYFT